MISNFVSTDVERLFYAFLFFGVSVGSVAIIAGLIVALFVEIGYSAIVGTVVMLLAWPLQSLISIFTTRVRRAVAPITDQRVQHMSGEGTAAGYGGPNGLGRAPLTLPAL